MRARTGSTACAALVVALLAGCSGDYSTLDAAGDSAQATARLFWWMVLGASLLTVFTCGLFLLAMRRKQREQASEGDERLWTHRLGLVMPLAVLAVLLLASHWLGERQFVRDDGLPTFRATASQWQWRFQPVLADGRLGPATARLVIPAGQPVIIELESEDVIHSFWVPRLAGKMDVIPGKRNRHRLHAAEPGTYAGQCAEYCGTGHAHMRFEVIAVGEGDDANGAAP